MVVLWLLRTSMGLVRRHGRPKALTICVKALLHVLFARSLNIASPETLEGPGLRLFARL